MAAAISSEQVLALAARGSSQPGVGGGGTIAAGQHTVALKASTVTAFIDGQGRLEQTSDAGGRHGVPEPGETGNQN